MRPSGNGFELEKLIVPVKLLRFVDRVKSDSVQRERESLLGRAQGPHARQWNRRGIWTRLGRAVSEHLE